MPHILSDLFICTQSGRGLILHIDIRYNTFMIRTFRCKDTERLANHIQVRRFLNFERVAQRKLAQLNAAASLDFLRVPPGNRLEALCGDARVRTAFGLMTNEGSVFVLLKEMPTMWK